MMVYFLAHSATLNMEENCSSETSVHFHRTTRCYIPEAETLHKDYLHGARISPMFAIITSSLNALKNPFVNEHCKVNYGIYM